MNRKGFTMIELLATIVILGILREMISLIKDFINHEQ